MFNKKIAELNKQKEEFISKKLTMTNEINQLDELLDDIIEQSSIDVIEKFTHNTSITRRDIYKKYLNNCKVFDGYFDISYLNGKRFKVYQYRKHSKAHGDLKFEMYFKDELQGIGTMNPTTHKINFIHETSDDNFINYSYKQMDKLAESVNKNELQITN